MPCEKLRRNTSTPAAINASSTAGALRGGTDGRDDLGVPHGVTCYLQALGFREGRGLQLLIHMANITPQPVMDYLAGLRRDPHERLAVIDREGRGDGLPLVYPDTGALLHTLARACGARRILEIGTAIGYSALWMATALPADGALITMDTTPPAPPARASILPPPATATGSA